MRWQGPGEARVDVTREDYTLGERFSSTSRRKRERLYQREDLFRTGMLTGAENGDRQ
jgi:hypothetical protein